MSFGKNVRIKDIKGKPFQINLVGAAEGIKIVTQLSDILVPLLGGIQEGSSVDEEGNPTVDFALLAKSITMNMDKVDILSIMKALLRGLAVDGAEVNFDEYFTANYAELVAIIAFCLKENFGSFFDAMDMLGA
jgi:hypothetical protein